MIIVVVLPGAFFTLTRLGIHAGNYLPAFCPIECAESAAVESISFNGIGSAARL